MPPSSRDFERNAERLDRQAGHSVGHAAADLTSAIRDAWSAGAQHEIARQMRTQEDANAVLNGMVDIYHQAERGIHHQLDQWGRQMDTMGRENNDRLQPLANAADGVRRGYHDLHTAADRRIDDFRRTRPETAREEGVLLSTIDGLITGGRQGAPGDSAPHGGTPREGTRPGATRQGASQTGHDTPETPQQADERHQRATQPTRRNDHQVETHEVQANESYWSIAAERGGTRAQIAARMQHLQALNHNRALLPHVQIIMDS